MIKCQLNNKNIKKSKLNKICKIISENEKVKDKSIIEISIVNNDEMKELCKKYYKSKITTDVLSFKNEINYNGEFNIIGEIFINDDQTKIQSKQLNHSYERELYFLIIHGMLHLFNYDHQTKEEEAKMIYMQEKILNKINMERK